MSFPEFTDNAAAMTISEKAIVFFDGECGLCHATVRFVLRKDKLGKFIFAPLQGETARKLNLPQDFRGVLLRVPDGRVFERSDAVAEILSNLPGLSRAFGYFLRAVPKIFREFGYTVVARCRRLFFRHPETVCPIVAEGLRERFIL